MKTENKQKRMFFAAVAAACFLYYIYAEFFTGNSVSAVLRAGVLLLGCVMSTLAALEKNKALEKTAAEQIGSIRKTVSVPAVMSAGTVLV